MFLKKNKNYSLNDIQRLFSQIPVFFIILLSLVLFAISFFIIDSDLIERIMFTIATIFLLTPDSAFDIESYLGIVQNTHIIGFIIFATSLFLHKKLAKEKKKFARV